MSKVLLFSDLVCCEDQLFWHRDLGLLTHGFLQLGHDAKLVAHPATRPSYDSKPMARNQPVIWASRSDVRNSTWWRSHKPDLVILGLWTRPKYDSIRRAVLSATPRVLERADSDGVRTASCGWKPYAQRRFDYFRDRTSAWPTALSVFFSGLYAVVSLMATPWMEARLAGTLRLLPALSVETPEAARIWKELAAKLGIEPKRIHCIPHPIQTDLFFLDPAVEKQNQIISAGRWQSYQKNLPLLLKTLVSFLSQHPDWSALVFGTGLPHEAPHPRIHFYPPASPRALSWHMRSSKIYLSTSRYESFGLAPAEALACGCALVSTWNHPFAFQVPGMSLQENLGRRLALCAQNPAHAKGAEAWTRCLAPQGVASQILTLMV